MAIEIERKFLLRNSDWKQHSKTSARLREGLISATGQKIRIRIAGSSATLCVKLPRFGISRYEFEYAIPLEDAELLISACGDNTLEKTRHIANFQGDRWEIDEYHGALAGLVLAEIELCEEHQPFARPEWLGREVTEDPRYRKEYLLRSSQTITFPLDLRESTHRPLIFEQS